MSIDRERWQERVRETWNARAPFWDEVSERNALSEDRATDLKRIRQALQLQPGTAVLDAGCGTGQFAIAFAEMGCRVTAIDLAPEMIARAQRHSSSKHPITWHVGDITHLDPPLAIYDAIHARVVMQFVPDVPAVLREFRRVLKPRGRLLVSVPGALSPIYDRSWMRFLSPDETSSNFMTPWELEAVLGHLGWAVIDEWGDYGAAASGAQNAAQGILVEQLPRQLQQAVATVWTIIAR